MNRKWSTRGHDGLRMFLLLISCFLLDLLHKQHRQNVHKCYYIVKRSGKITKQQRTVNALFKAFKCFDTGLTFPTLGPQPDFLVGEYQIRQPNPTPTLKQTKQNGKTNHKARISKGK